MRPDPPARRRHGRPSRHPSYVFSAIAGAHAARWLGRNVLSEDDGPALRGGLGARVGHAVDLEALVVEERDDAALVAELNGRGQGHHQRLARLQGPGQGSLVLELVRDGPALQVDGAWR